VAALAVTVETNRPWIGEHQDAVMAAVFGAGYAGIIVEEALGLNKAGVALVMAAALWSIRQDAAPDTVLHEVEGCLAEVSEVIFFIWGAMTIVEVVDSHQGFKLITDTVRPATRAGLLWLVGWLTFFMSSVLDNLTTTIIMVSLLQKLCPDPETRRFLGAVVVIAANAGGAWTPIGDVTTTMLWVGGQISTLPTMTSLVLPSAISLAVPMLAMTALSPEVQGPLQLPPTPSASSTSPASASDEAGTSHSSGASTSLPAVPLGGDGLAPRGKLVLSLGTGALLMVPVWRTVTGLPPYLGMMAGLGFLWLMVDALHFGEDRKALTVSQALKRIDSEGLLFFMGILLAVGSLNASGSLQGVAGWLDSTVDSIPGRAALIGVASAVVDNVPLVAATMGMYDTAQVPPDSPLWQLIAYAAGTGGSLLIIGSASGVAFMGMEKAGFGWYARKITPWALLGYGAGLATYMATHGMSL